MSCYLIGPVPKKDAVRGVSYGDFRGAGVSVFVYSPIVPETSVGLGDPAHDERLPRGGSKTVGDTWPATPTRKGLIYAALNCQLRLRMDRGIEPYRPLVPPRRTEPLAMGIAARANKMNGTSKNRWRGKGFLMEIQMLRLFADLDPLPATSLARSL